MEHVLIAPKDYLDTSEEEEQSIKTEDSMDMSTTVTIVEEDGTTSVVDDASIITGDSPDAPVQFGQAPIKMEPTGNMTYRIVGGLEDSNVYPATSGVQVVSQGVNVNGQYYLIGSQNMLGRTVAPRPQIIEARFNRNLMKAAVRDEKKRATHNEVERRRRDKINGWIGKLAKIVPDAEEGSKQSQSKGGILAKACSYINELRSTNIRLAAALKEHENTAEELDALKQQLSELRRENTMLKQQIGPTEDDSTVIVMTSD